MILPWTKEFGRRAIEKKQRKADHYIKNVAKDQINQEMRISAEQSAQQPTNYNRPRHTGTLGAPSGQ